MGELSIKVMIANRHYPLTIDRDEEENIRKAAKLIDKKIKEFEHNYANTDKQDLLAMCAIQFANQIVAYENKSIIEDDGIAEKLIEMDRVVSGYLERN